LKPQVELQMEEESVDSDKFVEKSASTTKKRFIPEV
jgi:hypothetical protein